MFHISGSPTVKYNTKEKGRKTIVVISGELEQKMEKKVFTDFFEMVLWPHNIKEESAKLDQKSK